MDITVIIPVYNGGAFLAEALGSVRVQTLPPAELIVADDGSTDGSAGIAGAFAEQAPFPVRVLRLPHRGVCATRNALFAEARNAWVFNLDADNKIEPDFLEKISSFAAERAADPDFAFAYPDRLTFGDYAQLRRAEEFDAAKFKRGNIVDTNCLFRAEAARRFGFDPAFEEGSWEDYDFFLTLARAGHTGAAFHGSPLLYRVHCASRTASSDRSALMRRLVAKHAGFWTPAEADEICRLYSPEAMARFRLFELMWSKRYGAMLAFAAKCLFAKPRVFFSKDGIPKLLGFGGAK